MQASGCSRRFAANLCIIPQAARLTERSAASPPLCTTDNLFGATCSPVVPFLLTP